MILNKRAIAESKLTTLGEYAELMSADEVSIVLGLSPKTVGSLVRADQLRKRFKLKFGFHPEDVRDFFESRRYEQHTRNRSRRNNRVRAT